MPTVQDIRTRFKNGETIAQIARDLSLDRKTIRKYVNKTDFSSTLEIKTKRGSKIDPYDSTIREYLEEDKRVWRKQRHTAVRIYERLRDEHGYKGSYETVQRRVQKIRRENRVEQQDTSPKKAYLPLEWQPGSAQVDFGQVQVRINGSDAFLHMLVVSFPYSNAGYVQLFYGETAECVCQGLRSVFEHIGGVPSTIIFDNATGIGRKVMGKVHLSELFAQFQLHYGFTAKFCNPYSGYEKGCVERKVFTGRSHLFTPVPEVQDIEKYNVELLTRSATLYDKTHYRKGISQAVLFEDDLKALRELPPTSFNCCRYEERKTNKYGHIQLDGNHFYSTRPDLVRVNVLVEIGAHTVRVYTSDGQEISRHKREFGGRRTESIDQSTALATLKSRPGAWEQCGVRGVVPKTLQEYIDGTQGKDRRDALNLLNDLNAEFGFETAVKALEASVRNGRVDRDNTMLWAKYMVDGDICMPVSSISRPLAVYDMFCPGR